MGNKLSFTGWSLNTLSKKEYFNFYNQIIELHKTSISSLLTLDLTIFRKILLFSEWKIDMCCYTTNLKKLKQRFVADF